MTQIHEAGAVLVALGAFAAILVAVGTMRIVYVLHDIPGARDRIHCAALEAYGAELLRANGCRQ